MKKSYLLLSAALLTVGWLFAAAGVRAELFPPITELPRTCNLGTNVTIVAGHGGDSTALFPRVVSCPGPDCPTGFPGSGEFKLWEYVFTYNGVNPSNAFLSVSADTGLFFATPTAAVSSFCGGDSQSKAGLSTCDVRFLRFNANGSTFNAAYLTSSDWAPRIATAGAKAGNFQQFCLLAGAGKLTDETGNSVTHVTSQTPGCDYEFDVGPGGQDIVAGSLQTIPPNDPDCGVNEDDQPLIVDGRPVSGWHIPFQDPARTEGSCNYTYTNTTGGKTTIACTTCCVSKSTSKCVLKSSLSSPSTQCTSGSLN